MSDKKRVCLNLDEMTRERLAKQAADAGRSMSAHIEYLVAAETVRIASLARLVSAYNEEADNG